MCLRHTEMIKILSNVRPFIYPPQTSKETCAITCFLTNYTNPGDGKSMKLDGKKENGDITPTRLNSLGGNLSNRFIQVYMYV